MHYKQNNKESKTYVQGLRPFGNTLPRGIKGILKKNGYNYSEIISKWNLLVGKDISNCCYPKSIKMTRGNKSGTLILSVERGNEINVEYSKKEIINKKLFPMTFGGEHSITPGCIVPFVKKHKNLCLLHFDAHADLRESYNGEKFSHASAIKRCLDYKNVSVISFGIRNISESEISYLKKNSSRINVFWAKDKAKWNLKKFKQLIKSYKYKLFHFIHY